MTEIAAIAERYRAANGVMMKAVNFAAGRIENTLERLPDTVKDRIEMIVAAALETSYRAAGLTHESDPKSGRKSLAGEKAHLAAVMFSGAIGGLGGLPTAIAELPVTTTIIFRAIRKIAATYGFDPREPETRLECIGVFGSGSPLAGDDGVNTAFIGARVTITGSALQRVIATVAPRLAAMLSQKLATQAVPVLGAVAGAGVNFAFMNYYQEMAHVRFGLRRLALGHSPEAVLHAFGQLVSGERDIGKD